MLGLHLMGPSRRGSNFSGGGVPKVTKSVILKTYPTGIISVWNRNMQGSTNLKDAITVTVNGTVVPVDKIEFDPHYPYAMGIDLGAAHTFKDGDVVTWAYNDQHPTEELKSQAGIEALNQTHGVTNEIHVEDVLVIDGTDDVYDEHAITTDN